MVDALYSGEFYPSPIVAPLVNSILNPQPDPLPESPVLQPDPLPEPSVTESFSDDGSDSEPDVRDLLPECATSLPESIVTPLDCAIFVE
jgi:hypothetical protein